MSMPPPRTFSDHNNEGFLTAVLFLTGFQTVIAQQEEVRNKDKEWNYRNLVDGLVSPNRPIKCDNSNNTISFPPKYDWNAQKRIEKNRQILFEHCEEALPFLIEGCTDSRYSLTSRYSEDDDFYSWSVARVCSEIIARHVEAYRKHMRFSVHAGISTTLCLSLR